MPNNQQGYVLMLEDDAADRELTASFFATRGVEVRFLSSSREVLPCLLESAARADLPRVVLLSLRSIPDSGLDVLVSIRAAEEVKHLPVVVLGENTGAGLVYECYAAGASTFVNKPFTNALTSAKINSFLEYWFGVAEGSGQRVRAI